MHLSRWSAHTHIISYGVAIDLTPTSYHDPILSLLQALPVESFGSKFPLVDRSNIVRCMLRRVERHYENHQRQVWSDVWDRDNRGNGIFIYLGGSDTGKTRIIQNGLDLMRAQAERENLNRAVLPLLQSAYSITVDYSAGGNGNGNGNGNGTGMPLTSFDISIGGESSLALRLLYRAFAEHDGSDFHDWASRFDVSPNQLTLYGALSAIRRSHAQSVPMGQVALLYVGVDGFDDPTGIDPSQALLESVVCDLDNRATFWRPTDCIVFGMLTANNSQAHEKFGLGSHRYERSRPIIADLLTRTEAESVVASLPSLESAQWRTCDAFRRGMADMGGHPRTLELYLDRCDQLLRAKPGQPLAELDYNEIIDGVIDAIYERRQVAQLPEEVAASILIMAITGADLNMGVAAHPNHPEWTYRKLSDLGYIMLLDTFTVNLPFVWLQVYLRRLDSSSPLSPAISDALAPLRRYIEMTRRDVSSVRYHDFNNFFVALRMNMLILRHQLSTSHGYWQSSDHCTLSDLFIGASMQSDMSSKRIALPKKFLLTDSICDSPSDRLPHESNPKDEFGASIDWRSGEVMVANVGSSTGTAHDSFFSLVRSADPDNDDAAYDAPPKPWLVHCRTDIARRGGDSDSESDSTHWDDNHDIDYKSVYDSHTMIREADLNDEHLYSRRQLKANSAIAASHSSLFAFFTNRRRHWWYDLQPPSNCVLVAENEWGKFYGLAFRARAHLASVASAQQIRLNVNLASSDELQSMHRVGPACADQIIKSRDANGKFRDWEDIKKRVKRLPNASKDQITF